VFGAYWQYQLPLWVVFFLFLILLLIPMEVGFRLGSRWKRSHPVPEGETRSDITLNGMLTLLALMLAFTYSFCVSRADLRKKAIITEVNAIGTAFLRADLLPEPGRTDVQQRLVRVCSIAVCRAGLDHNAGRNGESCCSFGEIQSLIWPATRTAIRQDGEITAPEKALLVSAVNDVLDSHTSRMAVIYDRLPTAVLILLLLIAGTSLGVGAFHSSLNGHEIRWRMTLFACIVASLMYLILDYDMMMRGFIQVDHSSLVELIEEMKAALK
jgi:hypothetical protein